MFLLARLLLENLKLMQDGLWTVQFLCDLAGYAHQPFFLVSISVKPSHLCFQRAKSQAQSCEIDQHPESPAARGELQLQGRLNL